ncbi:MAG: DNA-directed RNA polymerase subunit H [Candidatus Aenigmarchaeota archaeon]|nr:DNA-directed RNA polymerase subunit H [Candidatus Aenigmarchaeota archaeon]
MVLLCRQSNLHGDELVEKEYSVLKHVLVPKHTILNDDEKRELFKQLSITSKNLPRVATTDPVVKELEANEGDVLKIERKSPVAGDTVYYRVVVKKKRT